MEDELEQKKKNNRHTTTSYPHCRLACGGRAWLKQDRYYVMVAEKGLEPA